jgi:oligoendopeptidase F
VRLYDETLAKLTAKVGKESLTLPEALNRLSDPDGKRRKAAADGLAGAGRARLDPGPGLNTLAFEKQVEDRWRRFDSPPSRATWPTRSTPTRSTPWSRRWSRPIRACRIATTR